MIYTLSVDSFNNTFAVKEDGTKLTHRSGKRFKLFPFIANNNIEPVTDLNGLVGRYLSQIEQKEPVSITPEELIQKLKDDDETEIELGKEEIFEQVVRHMFFDKEGKIRPINLRMLAQTSCEESNECRLADYLVDVLGDVDTLQRHMARASERIDAQSNALERFAASKLETIPLSRKTGNEYQRITNAVKQKFEEDFEYILGARNRTRDYLIPLLMLTVSLIALRKRENAYGLLLEGAAEGLEMLLRIIPALVILLTAVHMLKASGAVELLSSFLSPFFRFFGIFCKIL